MCLVETRATGPRPPRKGEIMKPVWDADKGYIETALHSCAMVDARANYRVEFDRDGKHYNRRVYSRNIWRNMKPLVHVADFVPFGMYGEERVLVDDLDNVKKIYDKGRANV